MRRADSLEKTLVLGKTEGKRRRQKVKWLGSITDSMDRILSKLWETVQDRGDWDALVSGVAKSQTQCSNWITMRRDDPPGLGRTQGRTSTRAPQAGREVSARPESLEERHTAVRSTLGELISTGGVPREPRQQTRSLSLVSQTAFILHTPYL